MKQFRYTIRFKGEDIVEGYTEAKSLEEASKYIRLSTSTAVYRVETEKAKQRKAKDAK